MAMMTPGGAAGAREQVDDVKDSFRLLYMEALGEAERDARELLRACRSRRVDRVEATARRAALSAGKLAGFAANLGVTLFLLG